MRMMNYAGTALAMLALAAAPLCFADENAEGARHVSQSIVLPAATTGPAMIATSTTVGFAATGVPCYQCDPMAGFTIAIPIPLGVFTNGSAVALTLQYEDLTYMGPCFAAYTLVQGTTTVGSGNFSLTGGCVPNSIGFVEFPVTLPTTTGVTKVTGTIYYGSAKPLMKTSSATGIVLQ